jgi:hypothetical protein
LLPKSTKVWERVGTIVPRELEGDRVGFDGDGVGACVGVGGGVTVLETDGVCALDAVGDGCLVGVGGGVTVRGAETESLWGPFVNVRRVGDSDRRDTDNVALLVLVERFVGVNNGGGVILTLTDDAFPVGDGDNISVLDLVGTGVSRFVAVTVCVKDIDHGTVTVRGIGTENVRVASADMLVVIVRALVMESTLVEKELLCASEHDALIAARVQERTVTVGEGRLRVMVRPAVCDDDSVCVRNKRWVTVSTMVCVSDQRSLVNRLFESENDEVREVEGSAFEGDVVWVSIIVCVLSWVVDGSGVCEEATLRSREWDSEVDADAETSTINLSVRLP